MSCRLLIRPPQVKDAGVSVGGVDADGLFTGYASLFNIADLGRDMILPGAFAGTLTRRGAAGVKMLYQHDPAEPIGVWREIVEDARGLKVTGQLMLELARAREVHALMRAGVLDGLSIGFRTVRGRRDARSGVRRLYQLDLWEISLVTFPMQEAARIDRTAVRTIRGTARGGVTAMLLGRAARTFRQASTIRNR